MWEKGQKTKQVHFWVTTEDVANFSQALQAEMPELVWECHHPGAYPPVHAYGDLLSAATCPLGVQHLFSASAFARLPSKEFHFGDLFFHWRIPKASVAIKDNYAPDYVYPESATVVDNGSLGIRWNLQDGTPALQEQLQSQLKRIWKVFNSVTKPMKGETTAGYPVPNYRIGPDMYDKALQNGWYLHAAGPYVLLGK